jgi:hypothetical protein
MLLSLLRRSLFALPVVLVACAASAPSVTPVTGPDNQGGWLEVSCRSDHQKCRALANESCPHGYDVQEFRIGGGSRYDSPSAMDEPIGPPEKSGSMLIKCK